jgi:4-methyl-5(b-hydroxyethyl)-thiazole monophosphate biosynthesis
VALPGGMPGAERFRDCNTLINLLKRQQKEQKMYAAICATPAVALAPHGLLPSAGGSTCYPLDAFRSVMKHPSDKGVVVQGNVVTSQGPGTSFQFALTLGEKLYGKEKADKVAKGLLVDRH